MFLLIREKGITNAAKNTFLRLAISREVTVESGLFEILIIECNINLYLMIF